MKPVAYLNIIKACPLFAGITEADLTALLGCLGSAVKSYAKDTFIFTAGERAGPMGLVLAGSVHIVQEDFWGRRTILTRIAGGELFAEAFACAGLERLPVSVMAAEGAEIMLIDYRKIAAPCAQNCDCHSLLVNNMLRILSRKTLLSI